MTPEEIRLVLESWRRVAPIADQAAQLFYGRLFHLAPQARLLFAGTDVATQGRKLMAMLGRIVSQLHRPQDLARDLAHLARRHVGYGVESSHYEPVGQALLWTLQQGLGDAFTPEVRGAWGAAYAFVAAAMQRAAVEPAAAEA
jgi:hemoglobin-like flavoprotein